MDVKFDLSAANKLLSEMNKYCSDVVVQTGELLKLMDVQKQWDDAQFNSFKNDINTIQNDLKNSLLLQKDYMSIFRNKINELRG